MNNKDINKAFDKFIKEYEELKNEFSIYKKSINTKLENFVDERDKSNNDFINSTNSSKEEYSLLLESIKNKQEEIDKYYNDLFAGEGSFNSKVEEIKDYYKRLFLGDDEDAIKDEIDKAYEKLIEYRNKVFGYVDEDGDEVDGIKEELDSLLFDFKRDSKNLLEEKSEEISEYFRNVQNEYDELKTDVEALKEEFSSVTSDIKKKSDSLDEFKSGQANSFKIIQDEIVERKEKFDEFYSKLFDEGGFSEDIDKINFEVNAYYKKLLSDDESETIKEKIDNFHKKIRGYFNEVFGYSEDGEDGEVIRHDGIKDELKNLVSIYEKSLKDFEESADKLIKDKDGEIVKLVGEKKKAMDELLDKMGMSYNDVSNEALSRKYFELAKEKGNRIIWGLIMLGVYSLLLIVALIVLFSRPSIQDLFTENKVPIIAATLIRLTITAPMFYLIAVTSKKLNRDMSIRDQYNYKGSVMSTYRGISTHIVHSKIDVSPEKQFELLEKVYDKILENEADKLDKNNKFTMKLVSKTFGDVAKLLGTNKKKLVDALVELSPEVASKLKNIREDEKKKDNEAETEENNDEEDE